MDRFAALTGRRVPALRLRRASRRRARDRDHGLGRGAAEEAVDAARSRAASRSACVKVRLYRPFAARAFVAALPSTTARDRGARSHQGARRARRAAVPGRRHGAGRGLADRPARSTASAGDRRTLRAVVEGVHAGDGRGGLRRARRTPTPTAHFTVGIVDDVTGTQPAGRPDIRRPSTTRRCGRSSTASAPTAR